MFYFIPNAFELAILDLSCSKLYIVCVLKIQCVLQEIGSTIATPRPTARDVHLSKYELITLQYIYHC